MTMLITNMNKTNTEMKKTKKFYRIINIGTLKNESYGKVQFVKPDLEIFTMEKDPKLLSKIEERDTSKTHDIHTPESIAF